MPQDPSKVIQGAVYADSLTDDQLAGLDAIDKASVLRQLVADAVTRIQGQPELTPDELQLVMDYRSWTVSRARRGDLFHWRKPSRKDD